MKKENETGVKLIADILHSFLVVTSLVKVTFYNRRVAVSLLFYSGPRHTWGLQKSLLRKNELIKNRLTIISFACPEPKTAKITSRTPQIMAFGHPYANGIMVMVTAYINRCIPRLWPIT
jgi:hypothetical protein